MARVVLAVVAVMLAACGWQASPCAGGSVEEARMRLLADDAAFARTALEHGLRDAFSEVLAADAVFLAPNHGTIYGAEDIVAYLGEPEGVRVAWTPADAYVAHSCELGYTFGAWSAGGSGGDGGRVDAGGKYLGVWRYTADAGWRLAVFMQNADAPPEGGASADAS